VICGAIVRSTGQCREHWERPKQHAKHNSHGSGEKLHSQDYTVKCRAEKYKDLDYAAASLVDGMETVAGGISASVRTILIYNKMNNLRNIFRSCLRDPSEQPPTPLGAARTHWQSVWLQLCGR
jgi:hypothetical protein